MLKRVAIVPFEVAIAGLLLIAGISGLLHFGVIDPVYSLLPFWEGSVLNTLSVLSGILIITGIAADKGNIEQAGLLFLNGTIISRFLLYGHFLGYGENFIQTGIFDLIIIIASIMRSSTIRKNHVIIRIRETDDLSGND